MTPRWTRSIRGKLTGIIILISMVAVLLACTFSVTQDLIDEREQLDEQILSFGKLIGVNSEASLRFADPKAAEEALSVLSTRSSFIAGGIYTAAGEPFAKYPARSAVVLPRLSLISQGIIRKSGLVEAFVPITRDGERVGTVYIASDLRESLARMKEDAQATTLILLLCLTVAFILSSRLQGRISGPIVDLAGVAGVVSRNKDYSVRATPGGQHISDEVRDLVDGFNGMLAEIEERDAALLRQQMVLEDTVALRTGELTTANEELIEAKNTAEKIAEVNVKLARESALILNSVTDGIMGLGLDNRATFLNPAGARILGVTQDGLIGKSIHESIHHSYPDGTPWPEADCGNTQAVRRGEAMSIVNDTFWRPDGTSFPVEYSSTSIFDEDGAPRGAVIMFRDVTERRAIERLKSEFVSTVSHELRTPLTSIRGALGLLGSGLLGAIAEKGQRMLEIAVANTDRLVRLINDILDLERIGSGKVELERGPVDAHTLMVQASESLQSIADQAKVRLVVVPASATIWGDNDRIMQTLTNLIGNAIKFSPPDTTVTLSGAARATEFAFCITDQGRGVPREKLETIFERFSQVDASDSRDKGGSGLGLAICRTIVNAHGGRIWAETNDPAGSRFQFTIPLANSLPSAAARQAIEPPVLDGEGIRSSDLAVSAPAILIVEDDLDLARVLTTSLNARGIRTMHAGTGGEAVRLCREHHPSLIVLDLGLPDIDGFAVVRALRESETLRRLPLIVYSAHDVDTSDQARLRLGPTEFVTKSRCSLPDFEASVIRLLEIVTNRNKHEQHAA